MAAPVLSVVMPFRGKDDINFALGLATAIALRQLTRFRHIPKLYMSGVRWKRDVCNRSDIPGACERFLSPLDVLREGRVGDCDDLAPWRAAELILAGDTRARAIAIEAPGVGYHALVRKGDARLEDPSRVLGMPG